jgi:hypothetical protein
MHLHLLGPLANQVDDLPDKTWANAEALQNFFVSQSVRTFGSFVKDDWTPVVLPTLKYATQKHYRYMLDLHLIPAFGQRQLRELTREELQSFLSRKLKGGLAWETVHHFKCGLSKILGAAEEWGYIGRTRLRKRNSHDGSMERRELSSLQSSYGTSLPP